MKLDLIEKTIGLGKSLVSLDGKEEVEQYMKKRKKLAKKFKIKLIKLPIKKK